MVDSTTDLPDTWQTLTLGDLAEKPQYGLTATASDEKIGPHFLRITDIQDYGVRWETVPFCECTANKREKCRLQRGDVVIARIGATTGKAYLISDPPDAVFASYLIRIRTDQSRLRPDFLYYFTQSHGYWEQINAAKGGRLKQGVNIPNLQSLLMPVPPLDEQAAIAGVLRTVQEAKAATEKLVAAVQQLKQSLVRHLFSYGPVPFQEADQVELKECEVGEIPTEWHTATLEEVSEFLQYGTSKRCSLEPVGNPVLRIPNVVHNVIDTTELKYGDFDAKELQKMKLADGDILFVRTNGRKEYIGRCAVYRGEPPASLFASYLIRARLLSERVHPDFFQFYATTQTGRSFLSGRASHAADGKFNINTQILKQVELPEPSMEVQEEVVDAIKCVEEKMRSEQERANTLGEVFESLLHDLMTGERRVIEIDELEAF